MGFEPSVARKQLARASIQLNLRRGTKMVKESKMYIDGEWTGALDGSV